HYTKLCNRAGIERHTYLKWLIGEKVPDEWRPWLFGEPAPAGGFVVGLGFQRLRREMGPDRICRAAGLTSDTYWEWQRNPVVREALQWAKDWTAKTGARKGMPPPWPEEFQALATKTKNCLIRYGKATMLGACLEPERADFRQDV